MVCGISASPLQSDEKKYYPLRITGKLQGCDHTIPSRQASKASDVKNDLIRTLRIQGKALQSKLALAIDERKRVILQGLLEFIALRGYL